MRANTGADGPVWAAAAQVDRFCRGLRHPWRGAAQAAPSPQAQVLRDLSLPGHAGSWRVRPGHWGRCWWSARLASAFKGLDDDHVSAAARAWRAPIRRLDSGIVTGRRGGPEQVADVSETALAGGSGRQ